MNHTITRKSRIGFGWNTNPTGYGTHIEPTTHPKFTGSVRTVLFKIDNDPVYRSLQSAYKTTAWFLYVKGKWKKIDVEKNDLYSLFYDKEYRKDSILVEEKG